MTYTEFPNKLVSAANGVDYAYREAGDGGVPLVLLQHFRGNLDSWDPALIDALASGRRVVTFDNTGVGGSSGQTPDTITVSGHVYDVTTGLVTTVVPAAPMHPRTSNPAAEPA